MIETFLSRLEAPTARFEKVSSLLAAFRRIPYENLTKIIRFDERRGRAFRFGDDVLRGFLQDGSGGTCFSIVNALQETLAQAGIDSRVYLADRHYGADTHCALGVQADGKEWLLDPGYLIFEPIELPGGSTPAPGGLMEWELRGDRVEASTVFDNGHRKVRYSLKTSPATREEFLGAWERSFAFDMMHYPVVTRILDDGRHLYLRGGHLMIDGRRIRSMTPDQIPDAVQELGIRADLARSALQILEKE